MSAAAAIATKAPNAQAQSDLDRAALEALELDSDVITSVRLDGLALTKIVKHCRDAHPASASGALLGMDLGGTLEVSNVFALPNPGRGSGEREEEEDLAVGSSKGKGKALSQSMVVDEQSSDTDAEDAEDIPARLY